MATTKKKKRATSKQKRPPPFVTVGRRFTEPELAELAVAWDARDGATIERVSRRAGVLITLANVEAIAEMSQRNDQDLFPSVQVLATIGEALDSRAGIAVRELHRFMQTRICLVATSGDALVVALGYSHNQGDKVPTIWPRLGPWFRDLTRNRARIDAWLANQPSDSYHARGRVSLALVPPDVIADDTARIAELRATIVATPADDTPRLVLADLLQQRGDPQGTLIALQCKLAPLRNVKTPEVSELKSKEQALLDTHRVAFAGEVARCATAFELERGFVHRVTMTASSVAMNGERLFSQQPIQTLELRPLTSETLAKLAATPAFARVRHLVLRTEKFVSLVGLASSPNLDALETLDLDQFATTESDWIDAFRVLDAPKLRRVCYRGNALSTAALAALVANPNLPALAVLEIYACRVFRRGIAPRREPTNQVLFDALAARTTLRHLQLENCGSFDAAATRALFSGHGRQLHTLCIDDTAFDDAALAAMTGVSLELRQLELSHSPISNAALVAFAQSRGGGRLERLWIHPGCKNLSQQLITGLDKLPSSHPLRAVSLYGVDVPARFKRWSDDDTTPL